MAKEYIEREAAKNAIYEYICGHTMSKFPSRELLDASKKGAEGAMYELDDVPAADVVEVVGNPIEPQRVNKILIVCGEGQEAKEFVPVVRCKECKYFISEICRHDLAMNHSRGDDFCSYGERKEK